MENKRKNRALVSVTDKSGLIEFCKKLVELDWEIVSTGGTAKTLTEAGIPVIPIEDITGFPECLNGRLKTLHPKVHGGILYKRDDEKHVAQTKELGIESVDMVVVNLYDFEGDPSIENIDIGGPSMLRSAAKNFQDVLVVPNPTFYDEVIETVRDEESGKKDLRERRFLARVTFKITGEYDTMIADWFLRQATGS